MVDILLEKYPKAEGLPTRVICAVCGKYYHFLPVHLMKAHKMSVEEYVGDEPDCGPLHSQIYSIRKAQAMRLPHNLAEKAALGKKSMEQRRQAHKQLAAEGWLTIEQASNLTGIPKDTISGATTRWRAYVDQLERGKVFRPNRDNNLPYQLACPVIYIEGKIHPTTDTRGIKLIHINDLMRFAEGHAKRSALYDTLQRRVSVLGEANGTITR